ncbi:MAG: SPOR domain-containing protein [Variibacter sp.]
MADESKTRPYRSDAYATRGASAAEGRTSGGDPLAELARLIGQDDLFDQMRKDSSRPMPRSNPRYSEPAPEQPYTETRAPASSSWRASQSIEEELRGTYSGRDDSHGLRGSYGGADDVRGHSGYSAARPDNVRAARRAQRQYEDYDDGQGTAQDARSWQEPAAGYAHPQSYADQQSAAAAHPDYAQDVVTADTQTAEPFEQGAHYGEDAYDEPPVVERRRGGLITVAAVIGVALVGTAAAFGYRSWSGSGSHGQPPVINALGGPSKITPTPQNNGDQANKAIYDRADKSQGERVVSREEQPMDVKQGAAPRDVTQGAAPANGNEPRKVRTFAIRPDGSIITDASGAPVASGARVANASPPPQAAAPAAQPRAAAPPPPTPTARPQQAPARTASLPPSSQQAVPAGSYVVQLVSNKSEAEAQAAFRGLQTKYPSVLGDRQPLIRRVDLGDKGIYYRAQVGPFSAADEANEFCGTLKSAGGQCIVQKN